VFNWFGDKKKMSEYLTSDLNSFISLRMQQFVNFKRIEEIKL